MGTVSRELAGMMRKLERERDELRLQLHLGKAEAREEWEKLEQRMQQLRARSESVKDVVDAAAREIETTALRAAREIKRGYDRLRRMI